MGSHNHLHVCTKPKVQLFQIELSEKVAVLKSVVWNWTFLKSSVFGKSYQKVLFEKTECLANTYKSGNLSDKLSKRTTVYIYIYKENSLF